ncbi:hypothetical protein HT136_08530 [Novosphingobium profundi]|uniref:hypothetical protein n=1 Tax=Novosphingobium profundi TaxID=1774954 RepID=UPI001BDA7679|nr:hypothetical protein [Novosphingobium profundi]MBT0668414.1 hypothetical protein [Novosphingobium profundi]
MNPTIHLTSFKLRTDSAKVKEPYVGNVYGDENFASAGTHICRLAAQTKAQHYLSFARYAGTHNKKCIVDMTAVALSFPSNARKDIIERLDEFPYNCYLIRAQDKINNPKPQERLVLAVMFEQPIFNTDEYTRIASLLTEMLDINGHTKGDFSATFLFAPSTVPSIEPVVTLYDGREFLNPTEFIAANRGVWTNARLKQEGSEHQPKPMKLDESGLFHFPA